MKDGDCYDRCRTTSCSISRNCSLQGRSTIAGIAALRAEWEGGRKKRSLDLGGGGGGGGGGEMTLFGIRKRDFGKLA